MNSRHFQYEVSGDARLRQAASCGPDMSGNPAPKVLVIGIGNAYRQDDGVGLVAARKLKNQRLCVFRVLEHHGEGADLMDSWEGVDTLILLDAVQSGAEAGSLHRWDASHQPLPAQAFLGSSHAFSLPQAIELARTLRKLPRRVIVYGVEGVSFESGTELSSEIEGAVERLIDRVLEEIRQPGAGD